MRCELKKDGCRIAQTYQVDYSIWGALQQLIYRHCRIQDIEHLKEVLQICWEQIGLDVIDRTIGRFRKRLSLIAATGEGHIEHRFDYCFWCYTYVITLTCFVVEIQNLDSKSK